MPDMVTLTLAHPLSAEQAERVLAEEVKNYWPGDKIRVRRDYALSIINAGYAAVIDPADHERINQTLTGPAEPPVIPQSEPADYTGVAPEEDGGKKKAAKK